MKHSGSGSDGRFQAKPSVSVALLVRAILFMSLPYLPYQGEILVCDFDDSAIGAEMIKRRPVVVVSRHEAHRSSKLCSVVALSTTAPSPVEAWHYNMPHLRVTGWSAENGVWAKCNMISTVSLERLNKPYIKLRSGRKYIDHKLDGLDMAAVLDGIRSYLKL